MLSSLSTTNYYLHKYDFLQEHAKFGLLGILMMANEIKKKRIIQFSDFAKFFKWRKDDNGDRRGMSTSCEDEMIINLSQNDNWVKAKISQKVKCYN